MNYACGISAGEKDGEKEEKELPCLDKFLAKNTSEDNASFEQIMELAKDKEKLRHAWLYEAEEEFKQVGHSLQAPDHIRHCTVHCTVHIPIHSRLCMHSFLFCFYK